MSETITLQTKIPDELIDQIADKVLKKMLPVLESLTEPDQLLNVDDVAAMLNKSKEQIYQWVSNASHGLSEFPYQKAGRSLRFSKKDIIKWLKSNKKPLENG